MFGERLKKARKEASLTQKQLAELIGTTGNTISNWETGVSSPDVEDVGFICGHLNISPNFLFSSTGEKSTNEKGASASEKQLLTNYRQLNKEGQEVLLNQAEVMVISGVYKKHYSSELGEEKAN